MEQHPTSGSTTQSIGIWSISAIKTANWCVNAPALPDNETSRFKVFQLIFQRKTNENSITNSKSVKTFQLIKSDFSNQIRNTQAHEIRLIASILILKNKRKNWSELGDFLITIIVAICHYIDMFFNSLSVLFLLQLFFN